MNPLDLTEVRVEIAKCLSPNDLSSCALVCRAWTPDFLSRLYRSISLGVPNHRHRRLPYVVLEQNQSYVRSLTYPQSAIFGRPDWVGVPACRNLLNLDLRLDDYVRLHIRDDFRRREAFDALVTFNEYDGEKDLLQLRVVDQFMDLIRQNPQLQTLRENWRILSLFHARRFSRQLVSYPNALVALHLTSWTCGYDMIIRLLSNSPRLEKLHLDNCVLQENLSFEETMSFDSRPSGGQEVCLDLENVRILQLTDTEFASNYIYPLRIVGQTLEELELAGLKCKLGLPVLSWDCPGLKKLTMRDGLVTSIIGFYETPSEGCPALETVSLMNCAIHAGFQDALRRQLRDSLKQLDIRTITGLSVL